MIDREKVYCGDCRHLEHRLPGKQLGEITFGMLDCFHSKNKTHKREEEIFTKREYFNRVPYEINANNDCNWFELK